MSVPAPVFASDVPSLNTIDERSNVFPTDTFTVAVASFVITTVRKETNATSFVTFTVPPERMKSA